MIFSALYVLYAYIRKDREQAPNEYEQHLAVIIMVYIRMHYINSSRHTATKAANMVNTVGSFIELYPIHQRNYATYAILLYTYSRIRSHVVTYIKMYVRMCVH